MTELAQGEFIVETSNGKVSEPVQLGSLSRSKIKALESACKVTIKTEGQKITLKPSENAKEESFEDIAFQTLTEYMKNKGPQDITAKQLREHVASLKPKKEVKKPEPKKPAARTTSNVAVNRTEERNITTIEHTAFDRLLTVLSERNRASILNIFEEDARIGLSVEMLEDTRGNTKGLKAKVPVLPNGASGDGRLELVRSVLKRACNDLAKGQRGLTKAQMKGYIDAEISDRQEAEATQASLIKRGREALSFKVNVPIKALNGKSVQDFAEYMVGKNRRNAFVAFGENPDINFEIRIVGEKETPCHFEIIFDKRNGEIDMNDITLAQFLLAKLRMQHDNGRNINKDFVREFLEVTFDELKMQYTDKKPGDKISLIFASMAAQERLSLSYKKPEGKKDDDVEADDEATAESKPETGKSLTSTLNIASAVHASSGNFKPAVHFDPAPWKEDENGLYIEENDAMGVPQKRYPTANQMKYIEALRSGDVRTILLHGETGSGKTYWATRVGLEMLQQGVYKQFLYERATAVVGTRQYNPYRKGGDTGIFSAVLEDEIAKHLGMGNVDKGYELFHNLSNVGMIKRYEQMYRRGDNLDGAFLLADEVQQKDDEEVFHLTTRPKDTAKVVMVGDHKRQNDLGELSGFARAFNMFSSPEVTKEAIKRLRKMGVEIESKAVTTIRFGIEDIRRSPYTAYVTMVNDVYDEMFGASQKPEGKDHVVKQGHPADRYTNPPKV